MAHTDSIRDPSQTDPVAGAGGQATMAAPSRSGPVAKRSLAVRIARFVKITLGALVIACLFLVVLGIVLNTDAPPRVQLPMYGCFAELLAPLLGLAVARRFKSSSLGLAVARRFKKFPRTHAFFLGFAFSFASAIVRSFGFNGALHLMGDTRPEVFWGSIGLVLFGVPTSLVVGLIRACD
jgi:hypothetical protein